MRWLWEHMMMFPCMCCRRLLEAQACGGHGCMRCSRVCVAANAGCSQDIAAQVAAYQESITDLKKKVIPMGGFWWQLMDSSGIVRTFTGQLFGFNRRPQGMLF